MNRKKLTITFWTTLVLVIFFGFKSIVALRDNGLEAIRLRDNVLLVDKENGDVELALRELRTFVHSHMNTSLTTATSVYPPIQLKYTYDRLVAAEAKRVETATATVYADAQSYCENQNSKDFSGRNRVPCIQEYVTARIITEKPIEDDFYKFDFASPTWSPDTAGYSLLATGFFALISAGSLLVGRLIRK